MTTRIRGQEITVTISVDGQQLEGSMFNVESFTLTPRQEVIAQGFLGRTADEHDFRHDGYDFSFTVQEQDPAVQNFLTDIVSRNDTQERHPTITIAVRRTWRNPSIAPTTEILSDVFMKLDESSFADRKEYVTSTFSGSCKTRSQF